MLNRWDGNTGRVERIDEERFNRPKPKPESRASVTAPKPPAKKSLFDDLGKLIPGKLEAPDTEDIILLLILYLMYRESGDTELLIIMGAMFLL